MLTEDQIERYSRQILLPEVGGKGQEKLLNGRVLIIGAGGLGAPVALYLAAAGVGTIGIADPDAVDTSNLQRQVIHFSSDVGRAKVTSAQEKMGAINPGVKVNIYPEWINAANIAAAISDYDFVIDGTDNFAAKFIINDACVLCEKPYSHAGILRFEGQTITIKPGESACYRCVFPVPPPADAIPTCAQAGVIGVLPGLLGMIQATEAIKFLLGKGDLLTGRLLSYNALTMKFREIPINRNPDCPVCGVKPTIKEIREELGATAYCGLEKPNNVGDT